MADAGGGGGGASPSGRLSARKFDHLASRMNALKMPKELDGKAGNQHRFRKQREEVARIGSILPTGGRLPFSDRRTFLEELDFARTYTDTSQAFLRFYRDVRQNCLSFELMVHNRTRIVDCIVRHIRDEPHNVALGSILNLAVKLAALLGAEFYASFPQLFDVLVSIIEPQYVASFCAVLACAWSIVMFPLVELNLKLLQSQICEPAPRRWNCGAWAPAAMPATAVETTAGRDGERLFWGCCRRHHLACVVSRLLRYGCCDYEASFR
jgi:hypothetical protein